MRTCLICSKKFYEDKTLIVHYAKFHKRHDAPELAKLHYAGGKFGEDAILEARR